MIMTMIQRNNSVGMRLVMISNDSDETSVDSNDNSTGQ
jgi:hypothetical protein